MPVTFTSRPRPLRYVPTIRPPVSTSPYVSHSSKIAVRTERDMATRTPLLRSNRVIGFHRCANLASSLRCESDPLQLKVFVEGRHRTIAPNEVILRDLTEI